MNDYWNDPPESDEPPWCAKCEEFFDVAPDGLSAKCSTCGDEWKAPPEPVYQPEPATPDITDEDRMVNFPAKCPHNKEWFDCDACMQASDLAYDASRERRSR